MTPSTLRAAKRPSGIECNESYRSLDIVDLLLSWNINIYYFAFPSHNTENFKQDPEPLVPHGAMKQGYWWLRRFHRAWSMGWRARAVS